MTSAIKCWGDPKASVEDSQTETGKEENYNKGWMFDIVIEHMELFPSRDL